MRNFASDNLNRISQFEAVTVLSFSGSSVSTRLLRASV
jgi:hypothetical protein